LGLSLALTTVPAEAFQPLTTGAAQLAAVSVSESVSICAQQAIPQASLWGTIRVLSRLPGAVRGLRLHAASLYGEIFKAMLAANSQQALAGRLATRFPPSLGNPTHLLLVGAALLLLRHIEPAPSSDSIPLWHAGGLRISLCGADRGDYP